MITYELAAGSTSARANAAGLNRKRDRCERQAARAAELVRLGELPVPTATSASSTSAAGPAFAFAMAPRVHHVVRSSRTRLAARAYRRNAERRGGGHDGEHLALSLLSFDIAGRIRSPSHASP